MDGTGPYRGHQSNVVKCPRGKAELYYVSISFFFSFLYSSLLTVLFAIPERGVCMFCTSISRFCQECVSRLDARSPMSLYVALVLVDITTATER